MLAGTGLSFRVAGPKVALVLSAPITLSAVTVTAERTSPYQGKGTRSLTKTDTPLRDIPQAVTVLTRAAIADQAMSSLADVTRYVPGVTMGQGEGNRDQPYFRATTATAICTSTACATTSSTCAISITWSGSKSPEGRTR